MEIGNHFEKLAMDLLDRFRLNEWNLKHMVVGPETPPLISCSSRDKWQ